MHNFGPGTFAVLSYDHMGVHIEAGDSDYSLNEEERTIVIWAYDNGEIAGYGTEVICRKRILYPS